MLKQDSSPTTSNEGIVYYSFLSFFPSSFQDGFDYDFNLDFQKHDSDFHVHYFVSDCSFDFQKIGF